MATRRETLFNMVVSCCVTGCTNRFKKGGEIKLFRFPRGKRQRRAWVRALKRPKFVPKEHSRVCSVHFVSGWPDFVDPDDVDFSPSIFPLVKKKELTTVQIKRRERSKRRDIAKSFEEAASLQKKYTESQLRSSILFHDYILPESSPTTQTDNKDNIETVDCQEEEQCEEQIPTEPEVIEDDQEKSNLEAENSALKEELSQLRKELKDRQWSVDSLTKDDKTTQFYTGLPTFAVFMWLFRYLEPKASRMTFWTGGKKTTDRQRSRPLKLALIDQFLSVLMRLKIGLFVKDIADRFRVSVGTYSKIFNTWIVLMAKELQALNPYPSREMVQQFLPSAFKKYPNTRIVLDCTEIFVERPSALSAQNETFSSYKHHNTLKFLVGISPGGLFTFVSKAWGGRVSDREIVKGSGFLELVEEGDNIMADKGFTIEDLLTEKQAFLNIPPFLHQLAQFSPSQVQKTRDIAEVRIHVERAIGRLKNFHIFDGVLPLSLKHCASDIFTVCAYLTNLSPPIVPTS